MRKFARGILQRVRGNESQQVLQELLDWQNTLELPMQMQYLQEAWEQQLEKIFNQHKIGQAEREQIIEQAYQLFYSTLFDQNINKIAKRLNGLTHEYFLIIRYRIKPNENQAQLFTSLDEQLTSGIEAIGQVFDYFTQNYQVEDPRLNKQEITKAFEKQVYESLQNLVWPEQLDTINQVKEVINNTVELMKEEMKDNSLATVKEDFQVLQDHILVFREQIAEYPKVNGVEMPERIQNYFVEQMVNQSYQCFHSWQSQKIMILQENFRQLIGEYLNSLNQNNLQLFDRRILSSESIDTLSKILIFTTPKQDLFWTSQTLQAIMLSMNQMDNFCNFLVQAPNKQELERLQKLWLYQTNQHQRFFTILCLFLIISSTSNGICQIWPDNQSDAEIIHCQTYTAGRRQWLKSIIHTLFIKYNRINVDVNRKMTEFNLILLLEKEVAQWLFSHGQTDWGCNIQEFSLNDQLKHFNDRNQQISALKRQRQGLFNQAFSELKSIVASSQVNINEFSLESLINEPGLHVTIAISGWLSEADDQFESWQALKNWKNQGKLIGLRWESGKGKQQIQDQLINFSANALLSGKNYLRHAVNVVNLVKNHPFKQSMRKAEKTGQYLAELISEHFFGKSVISLIGFSLGTYVIYHCLLKLAKVNSDIIHNVFLLGGATPLEIENFEIIRTALSGRLVNAYTKKDKILKLYELSEFKKPIGSYQIDIPGVENIDVTAVCDGHLKYRKNMKEVLKLIRYNT